MLRARPWKPSRTCGRCGLTFPTVYDKRHHGCEQCGDPGLLSEIAGEVLREKYPDALSDPARVVLLLDSYMHVGRPAAQRIRERKIDAIGRQLQERAARAIDSLRTSLFIDFSDLNLPPIGSRNDKPDLSLDDFLSFKRKFVPEEPYTPIRTLTPNGAVGGEVAGRIGSQALHAFGQMVRDSFVPWTPIVEEEITVRARQFPRSFEEVAADVARMLEELGAEVEERSKEYTPPKHRPAPSPVPPPSPRFRQHCQGKRAGKSGYRNPPHGFKGARAHQKGRRQ